MESRFLFSYSLPYPVDFLHLLPKFQSESPHAQMCCEIMFRFHGEVFDSSISNFLESTLESPPSCFDHACSRTRPNVAKWATDDGDEVADKNLANIHFRIILDGEKVFFTSN